MLVTDARAATGHTGPQRDGDRPLALVEQALDQGACRRLFPAAAATVTWMSRLDGEEGVLQGGDPGGRRARAAPRSASTTPVSRVPAAAAAAGRLDQQPQCRRSSRTSRRVSGATSAPGAARPAPAPRRAAARARPGPPRWTGRTGRRAALRHRVPGGSPAGRSRAVVVVRDAADVPARRDEWLGAPTTDQGPQPWTSHRGAAPTAPLYWACRPIHGGMLLTCQEACGHEPSAARPADPVRRRIRRRTRRARRGKLARDRGWAADPRLHLRADVRDARPRPPRDHRGACATPSGRVVHLFSGFLSRDVTELARD